MLKVRKLIKNAEKMLKSENDDNIKNSPSGIIANDISFH